MNLTNNPKLVALSKSNPAINVDAIDTSFTAYIAVGVFHHHLIIWPEEKMTRTNAVVLMVADAFYNLIPANKLFFIMISGNIILYYLKF